MCTIKIGELLKNQSYPQAGDALYVKIIDRLEKEEKIVLDMSGVDTLPSMFLNTSIGRYIQEHGFNRLKEKISFSNIGASQAQRIKEYIQKIVTAQ